MTAQIDHRIQHTALLSHALHEARGMRFSAKLHRPKPSMEPTKLHRFIPLSIYTMSLFRLVRSCLVIVVAKSFALSM